MKVDMPLNKETEAEPVQAGSILFDLLPFWIALKQIFLQDSNYAWFIFMEKKNLENKKSIMLSSKKFPQLLIDPHIYIYIYTLIKIMRIFVKFRF